tara:strand:+ start:144 stop:812 length:669 start_codon:yes stop_codon:yes gene_type:complete
VSREDVVLFGIGSVAEVLHHVLERSGQHRVVAFAVDRALIREPVFRGLPLVAWDEVARHYPPKRFRMMIAVGYVHANRLRAERFGQARDMGYRMISYVSPGAALWDGFTMGENCRIGDGVRIQPFSHIGDDVFIGSESFLGHHCVIGDHCYLSASVRIAGHVKVEPYCYIGINATIRNRVTLARSGVIGAGAVIHGDTVEGGVYMSPQAELLPIRSDDLRPE